MFFRVIDGSVWDIFVDVFIVVIFTFKGIFITNIKNSFKDHDFSGVRILLFGFNCRFGIILRGKLEGRLLCGDLFSFGGG